MQTTKAIVTVQHPFFLFTFMTCILRRLLSQYSTPSSCSHSYFEGYCHSTARLRLVHIHHMHSSKAVVTVQHAFVFEGDWHGAAPLCLGHWGPVNPGLLYVCKNLDPFQPLKVPFHSTYTIYIRAIHFQHIHSSSFNKYIAPRLCRIQHCCLLSQIFLHMSYVFATYGTTSITEYILQIIQNLMPLICSFNHLEVDIFNSFTCQYKRP